VNTTVDVAIHRFLNEARQQGIAVYWWILPACESIAKLDHFQNGAHAYRDYVKRLEGDGLVRRLNLEPQIWPDRYFSDPWHVGRFGAAAQSRSLAKALESGSASITGRQADTQAEDR
jgi:hypothetical protein